MNRVVTYKWLDRFKEEKWPQKLCRSGMSLPKALLSALPDNVKRRITELSLDDALPQQILPEEVAAAAAPVAGQRAAGSATPAPPLQGAAPPAVGAAAAGVASAAAPLPCLRVFRLPLLRERCGAAVLEGVIGPAAVQVGAQLPLLALPCG